MADDKKAAPKTTDELKLGPGLVVTPGYEVPPPAPVHAKARASDRRIDASGAPDPVKVESTHPSAAHATSA